MISETLLKQTELPPNSFTVTIEGAGQPKQVFTLYQASVELRSTGGLRTFKLSGTLENYIKAEENE